MLVYKNYDQSQLNDQYNNRLHVPEYATYFNRWQSDSAKALKNIPSIGDIAYGDLPGERLDIFPARSANAKTLVFIHGGYWHLLDKSLFHFIADAFHLYDVTVVCITYPFAPAFTIDQVVASCQKAMHWLHQSLSYYNGNKDEVFVVGHSAGAHLAAMLLASNFQKKEPTLQADFIKGACLISGLFNLVPIKLLGLNEVLQLNDELVKSNSPVALKPVNICPTIIAVGDAETDEFKEQSLELYESWKESNKDIKFLKLPGLNHYSIVETLADKTSQLHLAVKNMMKV